MDFSHHNDFRVENLGTGERRGPAPAAIFQSSDQTPSTPVQQPPIETQTTNGSAAEHVPVQQAQPQPELTNEEIKARALERAKARAAARAGGRGGPPPAHLASSGPASPAPHVAQPPSPSPSVPQADNPLAKPDPDEETRSTWKSITSFLGADEIAPDNDEIPLHLQAASQKNKKVANSGLVTAEEEKTLGNPFSAIWG